MKTFLNLLYACLYGFHLMVVCFLGTVKVELCIRLPFKCGHSTITLLKKYLTISPVGGDMIYFCNFKMISTLSMDINSDFNLYIRGIYCIVSSIVNVILFLGIILFDRLFDVPLLYNILVLCSLLQAIIELS